MFRVPTILIVAALLLACTHALPKKGAKGKPIMLTRRAKVKAIVREEKAELDEALATTGLTKKQLQCKDEAFATLVYLFRNRALYSPSRTAAKVAAFYNIAPGKLRPVIVEEIEDYTERR